MKTWWQVYYFDYTKDKIVAFGFCSQGTVIVDHPDWNWKGRVLNMYKPELRKIQAKVFKICESKI